MKVLIALFALFALASAVAVLPSTSYYYPSSYNYGYGLSGYGYNGYNAYNSYVPSTYGSYLYGNPYTYSRSYSYGSPYTYGLLK